MVWLRRDDQEDRELRWLSPFGTASRNAGGRRLPEAEDALRTVFQRDRDRILHCSAFRRLQHKTQVVAAFEGDHFRSRMTHTLEVSQMARGAARALRLNDDLAEAIALAHDLGHPPFGHVGEEALDEAMQAHGGFRHNAQGARVVDTLEARYGHDCGLNLTLALRRSLLKGRIPDGFPLSADLRALRERREPVPIEAHLVDLCDKIAYLAHDLDDGLRAGMFTADEAAELRLWRTAHAAAGTGNRQRVVSELTSLLIHDLVEHADVALAAAVASAQPPRLSHGDAMTVQSAEVLEFLRARFYKSERVLAVMNDGAARIRQLFTRLLDAPGELPEPFRARIAGDGLERTICDYIAGMTDRYLHRATA
ncbi:MAG: dNTP triphosphohydrolase [Planctomycetes bacterium]|nr:dNTP triphosphohydrolase [Planctomycetota bacterium]